MAKRELTCIICPKGCALKVELDENGKVVGVTWATPANVVRSTPKTNGQTPCVE